MFMEPDLFSFGNKIACAGVSVWAIPAMISATFLLRVLGVGRTLSRFQHPEWIFHFIFDQE